MVTLATIDEYPDREVIIFDGQCNFCRKQVERLRWWAPNRLAYISLHDPRVAERYPDLTHDALMKEMYLIDSEGNRHGGAYAVRYLTRKSPRMWIFAPLMYLLSVPWSEAQIAGALFGEKLVLNEFVAFLPDHAIRN